MKHYMNKNMRTWLILATLIMVTILAAFWATSTFGFRVLPGNIIYHLHIVSLET